MNTLKAQVTQIDSMDNLTIVKFDYEGTTLSMMSLGLKDVKVGSQVILSINASHIAIGKDLKGDISLSNRFDCVIKALDKGKLLSSLKLSINDDSLSSIITTSSVNRLNLNVGDEVQALVKASEISIKEVIS
ncbi:TOBE domain-containing protein [Poseidonibacter lekithochrous]|uniref:TOBE domain-containing protein n=1 Tax=Poseidonibacter lekithochrous TaxID=1904463 RepID=UPI0008FC3CEE|nr:TOBE domain-containing protein [Poseidonibacter lekithochrous]QKJ22958.1 molybdenum-pterin binding domain-containing protein [Poseidonibacter lekithochrous]